MDQKTWSVYKHTFPNGKVYIGASCQPMRRWNGGKGYASNKKMYDDIIRYGWDNIKHEILFDGLAESVALNKERELLESYGEKGREKTYNYQHAHHSPPHWYDAEITKETARDNLWKFHNWNDNWLIPYTNKIGIYPLGVYIHPDRVELNFFRFTEETIHMWKCSIIYPKSGMTFLEVYNWLQGEPEMVIDEEDEAPIPEEWKRLAEERSFGST